jgi:hypothetical protein
MQSPCPHHLSLRAERLAHNASQACDAQPGRINVFYHEAPGDRRPRRTIRAEVAAYATLARSSTRITKLNVHAVALSASCPHYTAQALRARGKRAVVLPHAFGLPTIVAELVWCATSTESVAAESTATTTIHSPTHRRLLQALQR